MPLRYMARRLRVPATAALQRASSPLVSPAAAPRLLASRSPQIGEDNRAMKGIDYMDKLNKEAMSDLEKVSKALKNLPKMCALSAGAAAMLASAIVARMRLELSMGTTNTDFKQGFTVMFIG